MDPVRCLVINALEHVLTRAKVSRAAVVAIDTETTDFNGVVIEAAWYGLDDAGNEVLAEQHLLRLVPGFSIHPRALAVHGISEEELNRDGSDPAYVLGRVKSLDRACRAEGVPLVAHNATFD